MFFRAVLTDSVYLETDQGLLFDSVSVYLFVTSLTNTETRSLASYFLTLDVILDYVILSLDHILQQWNHNYHPHRGHLRNKKIFLTPPMKNLHRDLFLEVWSARPWWAFCCKTCNNLDPTEYPPLELTITSQSKSIKVKANENNGFQKSCFN